MRVLPVVGFLPLGGDHVVGLAQAGADVGDLLRVVVKGAEGAHLVDGLLHAGLLADSSLPCKAGCNLAAGCLPDAQVREEQQLAGRADPLRGQLRLRLPRRQQRLQRVALVFAR